MTEEALENVPKKPGVYELSSFGEERPLYIGESENLKRRLKEHKRSYNPNQFRFRKAGILENPKKLETEHLERYKEKYGEMPPWNVEEPSESSDTLGKIIVGAAVVGLFAYAVENVRRGYQ
ncbi:MAG: GIY-YIG nuclease family protein [Candidatus Aenigmatarchaeota archaeon]